MKSIKLAIFFLAIFMLALLLSLARIRPSISLGIFILIAIAMIYRYIHIVFWTNYMKLVDKVVKNRKNHPFLPTYMQLLMVQMMTSCTH